MLNEPRRDHHVADAQSRVQPAGDAGEQQRMAAEYFSQQGCYHRRVDLADAAFDHDRRPPLKRPSRKVNPASVRVEVSVKLAPKWAISSGMAQMRPRGLVVMVEFLKKADGRGWYDGGWLSVISPFIVRCHG